MLRIMSATAVGSTLAGAQAAEAWPSRPIKLIVPFTAGGSTDQLARAIQQPMSDMLGQPVVVDNKVGAGGSIGTEAVSRAAPDGYTLVFGNSGPSAVTSLLRKLPYDVQADFRPVSLVAVVPLALIVSNKLPVRDLKEFLVYAKKPGSNVNYGSVGIGSMAHLTGEYFNEAAGLRMQHIPYGGGSALSAAILGGELEAGWFNPLDGTALVASGKARYLAVATPQRLPWMADVPAISEVVPGFESSAWFGVLAPKGTPDPIVRRLNEVIVAAVARSEVRKLIEDKMAEPRSSSPDELASIIQREISQWKPVITRNNIKL
ncbi:tripartite tricarboxylate transporter substrate binding protein [Variovorax sp. J22P168]|uniref:Bug family tripartite tricarboxylate transporter substrate binding protein n=1 Tax=Variovorax jilinensis TaxID=3053513 RepID=UPI002577AC4E|nr:tripartite tricarboxylate transporter substrate binding protein [Variovorax sp. J22P168]MDM0015206.1 tripartite tricarboxylate transporter substrate binding protein [Variovorax sp. J22P168]